jgi:hypothetical protein
MNNAALRRSSLQPCWRSRPWPVLDAQTSRRPGDDQAEQRHRAGAASTGALRAGRAPVATGLGLKRMEEIDGIPADLALMPEELSDLAPLIRKFAISDDVDREVQMGRTSRRELEALASLSDPQWNALEAFLDEHMEDTGTPLQDVALVLSAFGEAAAEARLELARQSPW